MNVGDVNMGGAGMDSAGTGGAGMGSAGTGGAGMGSAGMGCSDARFLPPPLRNFKLMVAGQIVTVLGSALLRFALSLYVLDLTGRADLFAGLLAVSTVPVILSPIGGAISDRFSRRRLMVLYDAICGIITLAFLAMMRSGNASVFAVGAVMTLLGIVGAMETPNGVACVPLLVPGNKLESANGIIQAVQSISGIVAPVLGGLLYSALGIAALVAISGVAFALAAVMESFIKIPYVKRPHNGSMAATIACDLKDGFAYAWNDPLIRRIAGLAALINLAISPSLIVAAPLALRKIMNASAVVFGVGMGLIQFACILGALLVGFFSKRMRVSTLWRWIVVIALLFIPTALSVTQAALGLGFWPAFTLFMFSMVVMAAMATIISIFVIVRVQARTPLENIGKVMAIIMAVAQCAAPIGQFAYGLALESLGGMEYLPLLVAGGISALIAFFGKAVLKNET